VCPEGRSPDCKRPSGPRTEIKERMQALLDAGEREQALLLFFREMLTMSPSDIASLQQSPTWSAHVAAIHRFPRELQGLDDYTFDPAMIRAMQTPTLLHVGGDSPPFRRTVAETFRAALPNSQIGVLPAIETAPKLFVLAVVQSLLEDTSS
jgi:hypothetical protein